MDATRLGISFQEAQLVLRSIRERHQKKNNPEYLQHYGKRYKNGNESLVNHGHSSTSSPYFNKGLHYNTSLDNGMRKSVENKPSFSLKKSPGTSSIGKRLQLLKESQASSPQNPCPPTSSVRQNDISSGSRSYSKESVNSNENGTHEQKLHGISPLVVKATKSSSAETITSYLPKIKQPRLMAQASDKVVAKRQTRIEDFSSSHDTDEQSETNVEIMSEDKRELLKRELLSASDVACSLGYEDCSTLMRPGSKKSAVKGVYFAFRKGDETLSENNCCVFLPTSDVEANSSYLQWTRYFFTSLMHSTTNKIIYDAQRFMKTIFQILNIEDCFVCYNWQCFDPKIAAWLLDPDHPPESFDAILSSELGKDIENNRLRTEKNAPHKSEVPLSKTFNQNSKNMDKRTSIDMFCLLSLMPRMVVSLQKRGLWKLFSEVESKICPILSVMELYGVEIDTQLLLEYKDILQKKVQMLEQEGFKIVGHQFQMSSTQQLRQILFDQLQLDRNVQKKLARTHIKNYKSTSENVLKHLQEFHPLPKVILEYRHVTKLKSAYVDGILSFIQNGTLHTHWGQTCTATGRLTSTNPNIQAIPRNQLDITGVTEEFIVGKEMKPFSVVPRQVFKSRAGWTFLSADFQSIELRLLAHFSEDPLLLQIFNESEDDVFVQLAATWLSLDPKSVENDQRERAKRVVYSVVYGVGKERLAETLGVSPDEAKNFTSSFLATFPGLKRFIQNSINHCRSHGYVTTMFGRQRLLPGITSNQPFLRSQSERQAVNFIIQGSAADICKMGMILVVRLLNEKLNSNARLLIQIHDELLLEIHDSHLQNAKALVKSCLEDTVALCAGHVDLKVDFKVSLSTGKTWAQMQS